MKRSDLKIGDKVVITATPRTNYAGCAETMVDHDFWVAEVTDTKATFHKYTRNDRIVETAGVAVKLLTANMRLNRADGITVEIEGKNTYTPTSSWGGGTLFEKQTKPTWRDPQGVRQYVDRVMRVAVGEEVVISARLVVNHYQENLDSYNSHRDAVARSIQRQEAEKQEAEEIKAKLAAFGVVADFDRSGRLAVESTPKDLLRLLEQQSDQVLDKNRQV